jgi:hypothetical protein
MGEHGRVTQSAANSERVHYVPLRLDEPFGGSKLVLDDEYLNRPMSYS